MFSDTTRSSSTIGFSSPYGMLQSQYALSTQRLKFLRIINRFNVYLDTFPLPTFFQLLLSLVHFCQIILISFSYFGSWGTKIRGLILFYPSMILVNPILIENDELNSEKLFHDYSSNLYYIGVIIMLLFCLLVIILFSYVRGNVMRVYIYVVKCFTNVLFIPCMYVLLHLFQCEYSDLSFYHSHFGGSIVFFPTVLFVILAFVVISLIFIIVFVDQKFLYNKSIWINSKFLVYYVFYVFLMIFADGIVIDRRCRYTQIILLIVTSGLIIYMFRYIFIKVVWISCVFISFLSIVQTGITVILALEILPLNFKFYSLLVVFIYQTVNIFVFALRLFIIKRKLFAKTPIQYFYVLLYTDDKRVLKKFRTFKSIYYIQYCLQVNEYKAASFYIKKYYKDYPKNIAEASLLLLYKSIIKDQNKIGKSSHSLQKTLLSKEISKIDEMMNRLKQDYRKLFSILLQDDAELSKIYNILYSIEKFETKCDRAIVELLKENQTNPLILRKYSEYLSTVKRQKKFSELVLKEADEIENSSDTKSRISALENSICKSDNLLSYGSNNDSTTSGLRKRHRNIKEYLFKKIHVQKIRAFSMLKYYSLFVFIVGILLLFGGFIFSFYTFGVIRSNTEQISNVVSLGKYSVSAAHYLRKLQVSQYLSSDTPFPEERNTTVFRNITNILCSSLSALESDFYLSLTDKQKEYWKKNIEVYEQYHYDVENDVINFTVKSIPLYDALSMYSSKCIKLLELPDEAFGEREHHENTLEHNDEFVFVTINEQFIHYGLNNVLNKMFIQVEEYSDVIITLISSIVPSIVLILIITLFVLTWKAANVKRRILKGLFLLPRDSVYEMFDHFNSVRNDLFPFSFKFSKLLKYFFCSLMFIFVLIFFLLPFISIPIYALVESRDNSVREYFVGQFSVGVHRVHLWVVELLYRHDAIIPSNVVRNDMQIEMNALSNVYSILRLGSDEVSLGPETDLIVYKEFNEDSCSDPDYVDDLYEKLSCFSMNKKVNGFLSACEKLFKRTVDFPENERDSIEYKEVIFYDSPENWNSKPGVLQASIDRLHDRYISKNEEMLNLFGFLNIFFFVLCFVLFILCFRYMYFKRADAVRNFVLRAKRVFLLFPEEVIRNNDIISYLTKDAPNNINRMVAKKRKQYENDILEALTKNKYPIAIFDKNSKIHFSNGSLMSIFHLTDIKDVSFLNFFVEEDAMKIKRWLKANDSLAFNSEVICFVDESKFQALCSISHYNDVYFGVIENIESYQKKRELLEIEKKKSQELLLNILPGPIAEMVSKVEFSKKKIRAISVHDEVSFVFIDIVKFTQLSSKSSPERLISLLHDLFCLFDDLCLKYCIEKTIGDCYFAVCGIPEFRFNHAKSTILFSLEALEQLKVFNQKKDVDLKLRVGVHTGKCVSGIIGKTKWCYDVWGDDVNLASRMESHGVPNKIQVSRSTYKYVYSMWNFEEREIIVKGKGKMTTYLLSSSMNAKDEFRRNSICLLFNNENDRIVKDSRKRYEFMNLKKEDDADLIINSSKRKELKKYRFGCPQFERTFSSPNLVLKDGDLAVKRRSYSIQKSSNNNPTTLNIEKEVTDSLLKKSIMRRNNRNKE